MTVHQRDLRFEWGHRRGRIFFDPHLYRGKTSINIDIYIGILHKSILMLLRLNMPRSAFRGPHLENKYPAPKSSEKKTEAANIADATEATETLSNESLLNYTLSLSYEERLLQHERARQTISELQKARKVIYGGSEQSPENAT